MKNHCNLNHATGQVPLRKLLQAKPCKPPVPQVHFSGPYPWPDQERVPLKTDKQKGARTKHKQKRKKQNMIYKRKIATYQKDYNKNEIELDFLNFKRIFAYTHTSIAGKYR
jgi:hypothetical protein